MKKTTQKFATVFVALFALVITANAQTTTPQLTKVSDVNNQPAFQLQVNNQQAETCYLVIKDLAGTVLHKEKITEEKAVRTFALDSDAFSYAPTLIVAVENTTNNTNTLFEVKNNTRLVNDVVVVNVGNKASR
jgi:predicted transglutaminase-like cysteine proteinase